MTPASSISDVCMQGHHPLCMPEVPGLGTGERKRMNVTGELTGEVCSEPGRKSVGGQMTCS